jgi:DNA-binding MarR family transcriptional regulator
MIDQRISHRCMLADIAAGEDVQRGKPTSRLQTLLLLGFVTRKPHSEDTFKLTLTDAGHRYLAGLWH